jgi:hypothetical protein
MILLRNRQSKSEIGRCRQRNKTEDKRMDPTVEPSALCVKKACAEMRDAKPGGPCAWLGTEARKKAAYPVLSCHESLFSGLSTTRS